MLLIGIIGLIMVSVDVGVTATTTDAVTWDVEIDSVSGSNVSYDDDAGTITCLVHINSTAGTILNDADGTYVNPTINWTISPAQTTGLTNLDRGATSTVYALDPDFWKKFSGKKKPAESPHHSIGLKRIEKWKDRWDLLRVFPKEA